jgi:aminoacyl tRNA synthase complex-interacting multifunctional protein 1
MEGCRCSLVISNHYSITYLLKLLVCHSRTTSLLFHSSFMVSGLSSSAALCHVTVSKSLLDKDCILDLLLNKLVSKHQIDVTILTTTKSTGATATATATTTKKGGKTVDVMELYHPPSTQRLYQRDSIIRALAGPLLHYSLDFVLLGGHGAVAFSPTTTKTTSTNNTISKSMTSVMAMAQLTIWMNRANQIRSLQQDPEVMTDRIMNCLDTTLQQQAFLLESSSCATLADMDMAAAIGKQASFDIFQSSSIAIQRWYTTVYYQLQDLGANLQNWQVPPSSIVATTTPQFYYTEANDIMANIKSSKNTSILTKGEAKVPTQNQTSKSETTTTTATAVKNKKNASKSKESSSKSTPSSSINNQQPTNVAPTTTTSPTTSITVLDIRIGLIQKAWEHPTADSLLCELIDVGEAQPRSIASGLRAYYSPEDIIGKYVLVICNLKARTMMGFSSHGMVLCASRAVVDPTESSKTKKEVELMIVESTKPIIPGTRLAFGTLEGIPESESKVAKKKLAEQVLPFLQTNDEGCLLWKGNNSTDGHKAHVPEDTTTTNKEGKKSSSSFVIRAIKNMPNAQVG